MRLATGTEGKKSRVLSGMRPTGRLHIGHYFGALQNWVRLQNSPAYECFYFIADWHALTSDYADTSWIAQNVIEIGTDYLAAGLDPKKSVIFQQSLIPEHAELHLLLSMVTPLGWLERVPTYKEALENVKDKDLHTYGFLGYPILQCADIVIYSDSDSQLLVPVGEDQVSHVELSREIVGRFEQFYDRDALHIDQKLFTNPQMVSSLAQQMFPNIRSEQERILRALNSGDPSEFTGYLRRLTQEESGWDELQARVPGSDRYLSFKPILRSPHAKLTASPRIPGLDE